MRNTNPGSPKRKMSREKECPKKTISRRSANSIAAPVNNTRAKNKLFF
jgi:hypothetical protein